MTEEVKEGFPMIPNWFIDEHLHQFTGREFQVYTVLLRHAGEKDICFPSLKVIGNKCGISSRAVGTVLKQLQKKGFMESQNRGMRSSLYTVLNLRNLTGRNLPL